jgi:hypothetical protein
VPYMERAERTDEDCPSPRTRCEPFSIYGQSKLAAEGYIDLYGARAGCRRPPCACEASTAPGRTLRPRQASSPYSARRGGRAAGPPSSARASRRATTCTSPTSSRR